VYSRTGHDYVGKIPAPPSGPSSSASTTCRCLAFSKDGKRLYRGCSDGSVYAYDFVKVAEDGSFRCIWRKEGSAAVEGGETTKEGREGGRKEEEGGEGRQAVSCLLPLKGRRLFAGYDDGSIRMWSTRGDVQEWERKKCHVDQVSFPNRKS
jgi:WD40 repeat protein